MPSSKPLSCRALSLLVLSVLTLTVYAQKNVMPVYLKHGTIHSYGQSLQAINPASPAYFPTVFEGRSHVLVQFKQIPGNEQKKWLAEKGMELLDYIPENAFLAAVTTKIPVRVLEQAGIVAVFHLLADYKIDPLLFNNTAGEERLKVH